MTTKKLKTLVADACYFIGPSPVGVRARLRGDDDAVTLYVTAHLCGTGGSTSGCLTKERYVDAEHVGRQAAESEFTPREARLIFSQSGSIIVDGVWAVARERGEWWVGDDAQWRDVSGKYSNPYFVPDEAPASSRAYHRAMVALKAQQPGFAPDHAEEMNP